MLQEFDGYHITPDSFIIFQRSYSVFDFIGSDIAV